jgi:hypothetical protein
MKPYRLHLIYLLGAIITFGDIVTNPKVREMVLSPDADKDHITGTAIFFCAVWPLWWSGRFFKWIKQ